MISRMTRARLLTLTLFTTLLVARPLTAWADHIPHTCVSTRLVTVTEVVRQPVQVIVTRYDHCGRARKVVVSEMRTVELTVTKRIAVRH